MFNGKKTYVVSVAIVLAAVAAFLQGQVDLSGAINQVLSGLGLAALRYGVSTGPKE